jgi:hypothetical protein
MITFIEASKRELADKAKETRRMLEKVLADKYDWQPHPKSIKLGVHLAEMPDYDLKGLIKRPLGFSRRGSMRGNNV